MSSNDGSDRLNGDNLRDEQPTDSINNVWVANGWDLFRSGGDVDKDLIRCLLSVRLRIENLPSTTATFSLSQTSTLQPIDISGWHQRIIGSRLCLALLGTWEAPDRYRKGTSKTGKIIANPNYKDIHLIADGSVQCKCGGWINRARQNTSGSNEHNDSCNPIHASESVVEMWRRRREIIVESYWMGQQSNYICDRLSIAHRTLKWLNDELEIPTDAIQDRSRREIGQVLVELDECNEFSRDELSIIFGISKRTVQRRITNARTAGGREEPRDSSIQMGVAQ